MSVTGNPTLQNLAWHFPIAMSPDPIYVDMCFAALLSAVATMKKKKRASRGFEIFILKPSTLSLSRPIVNTGKRRIHSIAAMQSDNDVKLDTLSEPSAPLITENVALPKDIFKFRLSYLLYEIAHYTLTMISLMIPVVSVLLALTFHYDAVYVVASVLCFLDLFFSIFALIYFNESISDRGFKTKLLLEVIARKPALKGEEWRTITYNTNRYLFENDLWNTPYYFYSDKKCHSFFQDLVETGRRVAAPVGPSTNDNNNTLSDPSTNGTDNTEDTPPAEASSNTAKSYTYSSDPILEAYYLKALEVEQQAQRDYWRKQYPDVDMP